MRFFKQEPTIRFLSHKGAPHVSAITDIKLAKDVIPTWLRNQKGSVQKFNSCAGMSDWFNAGYIISAWTDIEIKANKGGIDIILQNPAYAEPMPIPENIVSGVIDVDENVKFLVRKIPTPWAIFCKHGYSAHVLPATYHSPFLRDLFVYSGTVDYDNYSTVNFMFSPIRACEVFIPAGTPLLQVIPFKREVISAEFGKCTAEELDKHQFGYPTRAKQAYRKFFHKKKHYTLIRG